MIKTPMSLQDLRRRIYAKAKAEPSWRFWACTSMSASWTRREAYRLAKDNNGAPGSDGVTFEAIEADGVETFLQQLQDALVTRTYHPMRLRHKAIPKEGGKGTRLSRFRPSVTVWSREPSSSSWNPSLKRTSSRVHTAIAQNALPMTPSCAWQKRW